MLFKRFMKTSLFKSVLVTAIAVTSFNVHAAAADDYPNKPINLVVGFGVGGSADRMTRAMSTFLADELGEPLKIINKKGRRYADSRQLCVEAPR